MRRPPHPSARSAGRACCALGLTFALLCLVSPGGARADDPLGEVPHIADWLGEAGAVQLGRDGVARSIFQPEFRDAPSLAARLTEYGIESLVVKPTLPLVDRPPPARGKPPPPPVFSRLLLMAPSAKIVSRARAILRRLDVAPRSAFVSILASEVRRACHQETGGSLLYDKSGGTAPENTLFRGFSTSFEPETYLRSNLTGVTPFEGTSIQFGDLDAGGGLFEYTLRMLSKVGSAQFLAWPNLVVHEGKPATMESLRVIPQALLTNSNTDTVAYENQEVGLKLRITPIHIGRDTATLDLDVWLRTPEPVEDGGTLAGTLRLKQRQVRTRVTLRDREPLLLGGLVLHKGRRSRRGMPRPQQLKFLDPLHSARLRADTDTEICFLIRMRCVSPGRTPAEMRPGLYRGWSRGETRTDPFGR